MTLPTDADGKLSAWAWPGGYPVIYLDGENSVLCPACAEESRTDDIEKFRPVYYDIHWEGDPIYCDQCSKEIESAYGPVE